MKRTRQVWPTLQISRTRQLTTQQGGLGLLPRVPQQGRLQLDLSHQIDKDKILPWFRRRAACFFLPFGDRSTRPAFSALCQWWHWCNVGWIRWCQFQTPRTNQQLRHLNPEIPRLHPEDPGLQSCDTGGWMSPGVPPDPGLLSEDRLHQSLHRGMDHQWTSQRLLTQQRTSGISLFPMKRDSIGKCQRRSTNCFDKRWHRQRDLISLTQPSFAEPPGFPFWIWAKEKWQTECRGWTSPPLWTPWHRQLTSHKALRRMKKLRRPHFLRPSTPVLRLSIWQWSRSSHENLVALRCTEIDIQYLPKPPAADGFSDNKPPSSYQISHRMSMDTEELARRATIYASLADSMEASVIEELSPKDQRSKLLCKKLAIIQ